ncbi:hypothetical protein [Microbacterium sp. Leaf320]|uniref:hypothetical protein n=1 Tax=Microbacterium sp. Leaf320 TaxID=1736334 RepID=UPI000700A20F|nr:hypothetical protein [Microbacterium sp. Leaf320]KQQ65381.1 hypothetical protein ASF63_15710 [Microbacterium sp. Leaf320]
MPTAVPSTLDWIPPSITVSNVKPGDITTTTFVLHNDNTVPIELSTVELRDGALFTGSTPLTVDISLSAAGACPLNAQAIPPDTTVTLTMTASLPAEAGNEYQGLTGSATVVATATEAAVCEPAIAGPGGDLASTGSPVSIGLTLVVAGALILGGIAVARRRRAR